MINLFFSRSCRKAQEIDSDFFSNYTSNNNTVSRLRAQDKFLGKHLTNKRLNIFLILIFCFLIILGIRTAQLQLLKGDYYQKLAEINRTKEKILPAARGLIYDSQGRLLIKNLPIFDAMIVPKDLSLDEAKRTEQIKLIAKTIKEDEKNILEKLNKYPQNFKYLVEVKPNINYEEAVLLKIKAKQIPGLYIEIRSQRQYLFPLEFSHLLGYVGKISEQELSENKKKNYYLNDFIGKTGLELSYEPILRGKFGLETIEVNALGQATKVIYHDEPKNGENLVLTIDLEVQQKVREILKSFLASYNKSRGSLVMLNPQNGEVIALVSLPDYDPNLFAQGIAGEDYVKLTADENKPLFNRAIKGEYPSGSTIKPVIAVAALQEGLISERTTVNSRGGLWLYDRWFFPDWAAGGHGLTNIYKAIAWSVNTYFYMIGGGYEDFKGLGIERLEKYMKIFGLGEKTGIDLIGEATGLVPNPDWKKKIKNEDWYIGDTYHLAIGQGDILVTPLQVANYTSVFANGGKLYQPHLVKEIYSNKDKKQVIEPKILRENFINQDNLEIIKKAMRQTVTLGSAQLLNNLNISVAGKTGTAQWHNEKKPHAWFTGFAPYDEPKVVITVLVEEGGEGSLISVPITYKVLDWYFNSYLLK